MSPPSCLVGPGQTSRHHVDAINIWTTLTKMLSTSNHVCKDIHHWNHRGPCPH